MLAALSSAGVSVAQQSGVAGLGQQAWLSPDGTDNRLAVTVLSGRYALAWPDIGQYQVVSGDEKLYVLTLRLVNEGPGSRQVDTRSLKIVLTDPAGVSFGEPLAYRISGRTSSAETQLLPNTPLTMDAGFRIPHDARINGAYVLDTKKGTAPGVQFRFQSEASLPRSLSPNGVDIEAIVDGAKNTWYPLGATDVRVESIDKAEEPVGRLVPDESSDVFLVRLGVRNRSDAGLPVNSNVFRESSIRSADGNRRPIDLLFEASDNSSSFELLPGTEAALRLAYKLPTGAEVTGVDIVEKIGRRGGILSRRYIVPANSAGDGGNATVGLDTGPGNIAAPRSRFAAVPTVDMPELPSTNATIDPAILAGTSGVDLGDLSAADTEPLRQEPFVGTVEPMIVPLETILLETVAIPDANYVLRLTNLRVEDPEESSGDEPLIMLYVLTGRLGEEDSTVIPRRDWMGGTDQLRANTDFPLFNNRLHLTEYAAAAPYQVMGFVAVAVERDSDNWSRRDSIVRRIGDSLAAAWRGEMARHQDFDNLNLTPLNRDAAIDRFRTIVTRLTGPMDSSGEENRPSSGPIHDIARSPYLGEDDGALGFTLGITGADDFFDAFGAFWLHVDDEANVGVLPRPSRRLQHTWGRYPEDFPTSSPFYRRFYGNGDISVRWLLEFDISKN